MKSMVQWLAASHFRMILVAAILALLPPLGVLGQAVIVLAVLLHGIKTGFLVAAAATALMAIPAMFSGASATAVLLIALLSWLPVLGLAFALRSSRSLSMTTQIATVVVAVGVGLHFAIGTPVQTWSTLFEVHAGSIAAQFGQLPESVLSELSRIMSGMLGAMTLLSSMAAVFLGRWWQALLQRPGAFAEEFRGLRMGSVLGVMAGLVFIGSGVTQWVWLDNLTLVLLTGFLLHGLAVVHAFAAVLSMGTIWLAATYILLVLAMPFAELAVAGLGFVDNWFNFRSRITEAVLTKK